MIYNISTEQSGVEWGVKGKDRIVQNVLNLLRTRKHEVAFEYDFGIHEDYIDNTDAYMDTNLTNDIIELIEKYEPRASVIEVDLSEKDENGNAIIKVKLEV